MQLPITPSNSHMLEKLPFLNNDNNNNNNNNNNYNKEKIHQKVVVLMVKINIFIQ